MIVCHDRRFISVSIASNKCWQSLAMIRTLVMFYRPGTLIVYALRPALRGSVKKYPGKQYVRRLLSQCFVSCGSTNYTALWVTGYLGDLSAVLVVDELHRQAVDRRCFKRPSRLRNWSVCTPPLTFTRRTASAHITDHRPKPLLPSSGLFSTVIHSSHPRHTACLLSQFDNWQRQSLQPTPGVASNILNTTAVDINSTV